MPVNRSPYQIDGIPFDDVVEGLRAEHHDLDDDTTPTGPLSPSQRAAAISRARARQDADRADQLELARQAHADRVEATEAAAAAVRMAMGASDGIDAANRVRLF